MERYYSNLTDRTYNLDTRILPYVNPDTDTIDRGYVIIQGLINGQSVMAESPVSNTSGRISHSCFMMMNSLGLFLNGSHHISHYSNFPEIVAALTNSVQ